MCDTPPNLKRGVGAQKIFQLHLRDGQADPLRERLQHVPGVTSVEGNVTGLRVFTDGRTGLLPDIVEAAGTIFMTSQ